MWLVYFETLWIVRRVLVPKGDMNVFKVIMTCLQLHEPTSFENKTERQKDFSVSALVVTIRLLQGLHFRLFIVSIMNLIRPIKGWTLSDCIMKNVATWVRNQYHGWNGTWPYIGQGKIEHKDEPLPSVNSYQEKNPNFERFFRISREKWISFSKFHHVSNLSVEK